MAKNSKVVAVAFEHSIMSPRTEAKFIREFEGRRVRKLYKNPSNKTLQRARWAAEHTQVVPYPFLSTNFLEVVYTIEPRQPDENHT